MNDNHSPTNSEAEPEEEEEEDLELDTRDLQQQSIEQKRIKSSSSSSETGRRQRASSNEELRAGNELENLSDSLLNWIGAQNSKPTNADYQKFLQSQNNGISLNGSSQSNQQQTNRIPSTETEQNR